MRNLILACIVLVATGCHVEQKEIPPQANQGWAVVPSPDYCLFNVRWPRTSEPEVLLAFSRLRGRDVGGVAAVAIDVVSRDMLLATRTNAEGDCSSAPALSALSIAASELEVRDANLLEPTNTVVECDIRLPSNGQTALEDLARKFGRDFGAGILYFQDERDGLSLKLLRNCGAPASDLYAAYDSLLRRAEGL